MPLKITPEKQAQVDALRKDIKSRGLLDTLVAGYSADNPYGLSVHLMNTIPIVKDLGPIKRTREQGSRLVGLAHDLEMEAWKQGIENPSMVNDAVHSTLNLGLDADAEYRNTMPYRRTKKR